MMEVPKKVKDLEQFKDFFQKWPYGILPINSIAYLKLVTPGAFYENGDI